MKKSPNPIKKYLKYPLPLPKEEREGGSENVRDKFTNLNAKNYSSTMVLETEQERCLGSVQMAHFTNPGIKENGTFSVNIPLWCRDSQNRPPHPPRWQPLPSAQHRSSSSPFIRISVIGISVIVWLLPCLRVVPPCGIGIWCFYFRFITY